MGLTARCKLERMGVSARSEDFADVVSRYAFLPKTTDAYRDLVEIGRKTGELISSIFPYLNEHPSEELKSAAWFNLHTLWNMTIDLVEYGKPDGMYGSSEVYKKSTFYSDMTRIKRTLDFLIKKAHKYGAETAIRSLFLIF